MSVKLDVLQIFTSFCVKIYLYSFSKDILLKYSKSKFKDIFAFNYNCMRQLSSRIVAQITPCGNHFSCRKVKIISVTWITACRTILVTNINCYEVIFYRYFNWNLMFCLKILEHAACYTGSDRFLPINAVMKG